MAEGSELIPTILLTGFLGAGKTTLLKRLISHYKDKRCVVLINEFGTIGIDGARLPAGNYEKVELNRGSLFCVCVRTDFIKEVEHITTELKPDILIVEATGIADTSEMEKMLALPNLVNRILLKACLCLVDCQHFLKIKDNLKAPGSQVRSADIILLNKIDQVDATQLHIVREAVESFSPHALILESTYAEFPLSLIDKTERHNKRSSNPIGDGRPDPLFSVALQNDGNIQSSAWDDFIVFLRNHANIMRLKGILNLDGKTTVIDATLDTISQQPIHEAATLKNQLVFIGDNFDERQIRQRFAMLVEQ